MSKLKQCVFLEGKDAKLHCVTGWLQQEIAAGGAADDGNLKDRALEWEISIQKQKNQKPKKKKKKIIGILCLEIECKSKHKPRQNRKHYKYKLSEGV